MKLVSINLFIAALHINRGTETIWFLKLSNQKSQSKSPVKIFVRFKSFDCPQLFEDKDIVLCLSSQAKTGNFWVTHRWYFSCNKLKQIFSRSGNNSSLREFALSYFCPQFSGKGLPVMSITCFSLQRSNPLPYLSRIQYELLPNRFLFK